MFSLRTLFALLIALAVMAAGAGLRPASADAAEPPCHSSMSHDRPSSPVPSEEPGDAAAAAVCCAGCLPAVRTDEGATVEAGEAGSQAHAWAPERALDGLARGPEPQPPRA